MELTPRFVALPDVSFFLFGPRGTGKTTWLRQTTEQAVWVNLLDPEEYRSLSARPERLREIVQGAEHTRKTVVIDEIQRVPELLHVIHDLIERGVLRGNHNSSSFRPHPLIR